MKFTWQSRQQVEAEAARAAEKDGDLEGLLPKTTQPVETTASKSKRSSQWILVLILFLCCTFISQDRQKKAKRRQANVVVQYAGESIQWTKCGEITGHRLECSEIDVPMDQFDAERSGNKTFSIPLIRMRGHNATQSVFLNPGGPGGSGINLVYRRGEQLNTIIGEGFHLLSFDPRGVNSSKPAASCYPTEEAARAAPKPSAEDVPGHAGELDAYAANFVRACRDNMGEHGKYVNTPQTAADMNSILDAVGQQDLAYWGLSYGTLLGQTYAKLFPDRAKRVIIDGVVNYFNWYDAAWDEEEFHSSEDVFTGFTEECIKAGDMCALNKFNYTSAAELKSEILRATDALADSPLPVYLNATTYGALTHEHILHNAIFPALYKPASWFKLAQNLAALIDGNATQAWLDYGRGHWFELPDQSNEFVSFNDGASGQKLFDDLDRAQLVARLGEHYKSSRFAGDTGLHYFEKQKWLVQRTHDFRPESGVQTAHPLLILSTTYDPICPLKSAKVANAAFEGSRIVEVLGYGHCSVAVASMCANRHVRDFLYHGILPNKNVKCTVDSKYFVDPDDEQKKDEEERVNINFEDPELRAIQRAQLELARDPLVGRLRR